MKKQKYLDKSQLIKIVIKKKFPILIQNKTKPPGIKLGKKF